MKQIAAICCCLFSVSVYASPGNNFYLDLGWQTPAGKVVFRVWDAPFGTE